MRTLRSSKSSNPMSPSGRLQKCPKCSVRFRLKYDLKVHIRTHRKVKLEHAAPLQKAQDADDSIQEAAKKAKRELFSETKFECDKCDKQFTSEKSLEQHAGTHGKPFKCKTCLNEFTYEKSFLKHVAKHRLQQVTIDESNYSCNTCDRKFRTYNSLSAHRVTHDENEEPPELVMQSEEEVEVLNCSYPPTLEKMVENDENKMEDNDEKIGEDSDRLGDVVGESMEVCHTSNGMNESTEIKTNECGKSETTVEENIEVAFKINELGSKTKVTNKLEEISIAEKENNYKNGQENYDTSKMPKVVHGEMNENNDISNLNKMEENTEKKQMITQEQNNISDQTDNKIIDGHINANKTVEGQTKIIKTIERQVNTDTTIKNETSTIKTVGGQADTGKTTETQVNNNKETSEDETDNPIKTKITCISTTVQDEHQDLMEVILMQEIASHQAKPTLFQCEECSEIFNQQSDYQEHTHDSPTLQCEMCGDIFTNEDELQKHKADHPNPVIPPDPELPRNPVPPANSATSDSINPPSTTIPPLSIISPSSTLSQCEMCGDIFNNEDDLQKHKADHPNPVIPPDPELPDDSVPPANSATSAGLINPSTTIPPLSIISPSSPVPPLSIISPSSAVRSVLVIPPKSAIPANPAIPDRPVISLESVVFRDSQIPAFVVARRGVARVSVSTSHPENAEQEIFHCEFCGKLMVTESALTHHLKFCGKDNKNLTETQTAYCKTCNSFFDSHAAFHTHLKVTMPPDSRAPSFECGTCHLKFLRECGLNNHTFAHFGRPPECKACGVTFNCQNSYKEHKQVHAEELEERLSRYPTVKPKWQCEFCKVLFGQKDELLKHLGGREFSCAVCKLQFCTAALLEAHQQTHSDRQEADEFEYVYEEVKDIDPSALVWQVI